MIFYGINKFLKKMKKITKKMNNIEKKKMKRYYKK